ncbi:MAG: squalene/phytoene synthase family protein [Pyrinomonadaceae bacterium]
MKAHTLSAAAYHSASSPLELAKAYRFCQQTTRRHAKSFYLSAQFLPRAKRQAIYAIYALCRHVDDAVDQAGTQSADDARAAVERWSRELDKVYRGGQQKEMPADPVLIAWGDMLGRYAIRQELPLELMRGVLMDTHINRYETWDDLSLYCYRVASVVGLMSSEVFGYQEPQTLKYAEALGLAMQLTNIYVTR